MKLDENENGNGSNLTDDQIQEQIKSYFKSQMKMKEDIKEFFNSSSILVLVSVFLHEKEFEVNIDRFNDEIKIKETKINWTNGRKMGNSSYIQLSTTLPFLISKHKNGLIIFHQIKYFINISIKSKSIRTRTQ